MTETTISASLTAVSRAVTCDVWREGKAGEEERVFARRGDLARFLSAVRPEGDVVAAAAAEGESDGGSPGAGAEYDNSTHAVFPGSEAGFRAGEQAADVLVMFDDDEQGDGALDGDEERVGCGPE